MDKKKIAFLIFSFCIFVIIVFLRDVTPDNELKYISIVAESFKNGDFITFKNHGVAYADKPPLYFWVIMLVKTITGTYNTAGVGLFSLVPAILIIILMFRWTRDELDEGEQLLAGGMLITTVIFTGMAMILRMDMLMTLFTTLSLYHFYKGYRGGGVRKQGLLACLYMFLGMFTKGPMGILVPLLTIVSFLLFKRKLKEIKKYLPLGGIALILGLCTFWFSAVYLEGGKEYLYDITIRQTVGRGVDSFSHKEPFYYYLEEMWVSFLPWSFLYVFMFFSSFRKKGSQSDLEIFFKTAIISNFIFLSLMSGKLEIYLLPIYPFIPFVVLMAMKRKTGEKIWKYGLLVPAVILVGLLPAYLVASRMTELPVSGDLYLYAALAAVTVGGVYSLKKIYDGKFKGASWGIVYGFLFFFFFMAFKVPEINPIMGVKTIAFKGEESLKGSEDKKYYGFDFRHSEHMDVYLNERVENIKEIEVLREKLLNEKFVLFVRVKDIKKKESLKDLLKEMDEIYINSKFGVYKTKE